MKSFKFQQKMIKFLRAGIRGFGLILAARYILFYKDKDDCWAAVGDMVPMEFHKAENGKFSFFRGQKLFDIKDEMIP